MKTIRLLPFLLLLLSGFAFAESIYYKGPFESRVLGLEKQAWQVVKVMKYRTGKDSHLTRSARRLAREVKHFKGSVVRDGEYRVQVNFRRLDEEFRRFDDLIWRDYIFRRYGHVRDEVKKLRRRFHSVRRMVENHWGRDRYYRPYRDHEYHNYGY
jgi:hypothetical protein